MYLPYSAKFSRSIILAVITDSFQTVKMKLGKVFSQIYGLHNLRFTS